MKKLVKSVLVACMLSLTVPAVAFACDGHKGSDKADNHEEGGKKDKKKVKKEKKDKEEKPEGGEGEKTE